jgi:hypothetical protein
MGGKNRPKVNPMSTIPVSLTQEQFEQYIRPVYDSRRLGRGKGAGDRSGKAKGG